MLEEDSRKINFLILLTKGIMKTYVFYTDNFKLEYAVFSSLKDAKTFTEKMMSEDKYLTADKIKIVSNGELIYFGVKETVNVSITFEYDGEAS